MASKCKTVSCEFYADHSKSYCSVCFKTKKEEEEWVKPHASRRSRKSRSSPTSSELSHGSEFLKQFKVFECPKLKEYHELKFCHFSHSKEDCRRNPFESIYDVTECKNKVEEAYHPLIFRTSFCQRKQTCPFYEKKVCSFAHSEQELQSSHEIIPEYQRLIDAENQKKYKQRVGSDFDGVLKKTSSKKPSPPNATFFPPPKFLTPAPKTQVQTTDVTITKVQQYLVEHKPGWYSKMEHLCKSKMVQLQRFELKLRFSGVNHLEVSKEVKQKLEKSVKDHSTSSKIWFNVSLEAIADKYNRELQLLHGALELQHLPDDRCQFMFCSLDNTQKKSFKRIVSEMHGVMKNFGYNEIVECQICCDSVLEMKAIVCENKHAVCLNCFPNWLNDQKNGLRHKSNVGLHCPSKCMEDPLPDDQFRKLPADLIPLYFDTVYDARFDKKWKKKEMEFESKLNELVQKELDKYLELGPEDLVRVEAKRHADKFRNAVLNLKCPHCEQVYADFDGCVALTCASCKKHFCGFCHQKSPTSHAAHQHVRECRLNLTTDGNLYADNVVIQSARRRYREEQIKQHIRKLKTRKLQNAVLIELKHDLKDLDLSLEKLMDFGAELIP